MDIGKRTRVACCKTSVYTSCAVTTNVNARATLCAEKAACSVKQLANDDRIVGCFRGEPTAQSALKTVASRFIGGRGESCRGHES